jgi:hypothetical protein
MYIIWIRKANQKVGYQARGRLAEVLNYVAEFSH